MDDRISNDAQVESANGSNALQEIDITEAVRKSPILTRLVEEVRIENLSGPQSYNRMHNRHNRSR